MRKDKELPPAIVVITSNSGDAFGNDSVEMVGVGSSSCESVEAKGVPQSGILDFASNPFGIADFFDASRAELMMETPTPLEHVDKMQQRRLTATMLT